MRWALEKINASSAVRDIFTARALLSLPVPKLSRNFKNNSLSLGIGVIQAGIGCLTDRAGLELMNNAARLLCFLCWMCFTCSKLPADAMGKNRGTLPGFVENSM
jgi:hypothetical protein